MSFSQFYKNTRVNPFYNLNLFYPLSILDLSIIILYTLCLFYIKIINKVKSFLSNKCSKRLKQLGPKLSIYLAIYLSIYVSLYKSKFIHLTLFIYQSVFMVFISIYLYIYIYMHLSNYLSIYLSIYISNSIHFYIY